jgi:hypothetical protein
MAPHISTADHQHKDLLETSKRTVRTMEITGDERDINMSIMTLPMVEMAIKAEEANVVEMSRILIRISHRFRINFATNWDKKREDGVVVGTGVMVDQVNLIRRFAPPPAVAITITTNATVLAVTDEEIEKLRWPAPVATVEVHLGPPRRKNRNNSWPEMKICWERLDQVLYMNGVTNERSNPYLSALV